MELHVNCLVQQLKLVVKFLNISDMLWWLSAISVFQRMPYAHNTWHNSCFPPCMHNAERTKKMFKKKIKFIFRFNPVPTEFVMWYTIIMIKSTLA